VESILAVILIVCQHLEQDGFRVGLLKIIRDYLINCKLGMILEIESRGPAPPG